MSHKVLLAFASLCFFVTTYAHQRHFDSPTAVSRLNLLQSLYFDHCFDINAYHTNTPDKALIRGNYYSDKAPGTVAVTLPAFYLACEALSFQGVKLQSKTGLLAASWLSCAISIGSIVTLGALACFAWLERYVDARSAFLTTMTFFLGAAPLPYSTLLYSHALVVALLFVTVWAADGNRDAKVTGAFRQNVLDILAGFSAGLALASEYTAGLVVVGLVLWLYGSKPRRCLSFVLGAAPSLALVPLYSFLTIGSPFDLPYSYQASFPVMQEGLYAIKWPDFQTAERLLFGTTRGLFFWSPFLLSAVLGFWRLFKWNIGIFWFCYGTFVVQVGVMSGRVWDWQAGPSFGPRYLAPALIALALPCALATARWRLVAGMLAVVSILLTTGVTLTDASFPGHVVSPLTDVTLPLLVRCDLNPNLGTLIGLGPFESLVVFYFLLALGTWWIWVRLPHTMRDCRVKGLDR